MSALMILDQEDCACDEDDDNDVDPNPILSDHLGDPVLELFDSQFIGDIEALAVHYLQKFFQNKNMYYGGPIPRNLLKRPQYIDRVLGYNIDNAVKAIYEAWHTAALGVVTLKEVRLINSHGRIPSDVEAVLMVLRECAHSGVPRPLAGGIAMTFFEFCEGFNFSKVSAPVTISVEAA